MRSSFLWGLGLVFSILLCARSVSASSPVVIGEIGWAGSDASTADEWIELWNVSDASIALDGYVVSGAGGTNGIPLTGNIIQAHHAFVIANYADTDAKSTLAFPPDVVTTTISLSNSAMAITLIDGSGTVVDRAGDGSAPFAGTTTPKKTSMLRTASMQDGSLTTSWASANTVYGFDGGAQEIGTPHWCDSCTAPQPIAETATTTVEIATPSPETPTSTIVDLIPLAEITATSTEPSPPIEITAEVILPNDPISTESTSSLVVVEATSTTVEASSTIEEVTIFSEATNTDPVLMATSSEPAVITTSTIPVVEVSNTASTPTPTPVPIPILVTTVSASESSSSGTSTAKPKSASPKSSKTKTSVTTTPVTTPAKPTQTKNTPILKSVVVESASSSAPSPIKPAKKTPKTTSVSKGVRVTLTGTVATPPFWLATSFILQAQDGRGLMVRVGKSHTQPPIGTKIRITGTLKQTSKGAELSVGVKDGWSIVDTHGTVTTSTANLLEPTKDDDWRLVTIQGTVSRVRSKSLDVDIEDTSLAVRMRTTVEYRTERIHTGDTVSITGILDATGYEPILYPRVADDIQIVSVAEKASASTVPVGSNLPPWTPFGVAGATVAFSEGWRRAQKIYEQRKLNRLLAEEQRFFIEKL